MQACDNPIYIEVTHPVYNPVLKKMEYYLPVGCGRCFLCAERKVRQWSFRMEQEKLVSNSVHFVTLTYNTEYVPITNKGFMTLDHKHLQKYIKRLRQRMNRDKNPNWYNPYWETGKPIKYYAVGEYGTHGKRPHYHLIIFNAKKEHIKDSWENFIDRDTGEIVNMGMVDVQVPRAGAIPYVMKYVSKPSRYPFPEHVFDGIPEFNRSSTGLGENYLSDKIIDEHRKYYRYYVVQRANNIKCSLPEYYRKKIWTQDEWETEVRQIISDQMYELAKQKRKEFIKLRLNMTYSEYELSCQNQRKYLRLKRERQRQSL